MCGLDLCFTVFWCFVGLVGLQSEEDLQRVVNEFYNVCKRRKLKVNAGKSKVMVFERREGEVIDFNVANRVRMPAVARCKIMLGREKMDEVSEFKYLGTVKERKEEEEEDLGEEKEETMEEKEKVV